MTTLALVTMALLCASNILAVKRLARVREKLAALKAATNDGLISAPSTDNREPGDLTIGLSLGIGLALYACVLWIALAEIDSRRADCKGRGGRLEAATCHMPAEE